MISIGDSVLIKSLGKCAKIENIVHMENNVKLYVLNEKDLHTRENLVALGQDLHKLYRVELLDPIAVELLENLEEYGKVTLWDVPTVRRELFPRYDIPIQAIQNAVNLLVRAGAVIKHRTDSYGYNKYYPKD